MLNMEFKQDFLGLKVEKYDCSPNLAVQEVIPAYTEIVKICSYDRNSQTTYSSQRGETVLCTENN